MKERPIFIDPVSTFGDDVGDGPVPGWLKLVVVLLALTAGFYAFSYYEGPKLTSNHTFLEGSGGGAPASGADAPAH